jgi:hypothetical protein
MTNHYVGNSCDTSDSIVVVQSTVKSSCLSLSSAFSGSDLMHTTCTGTHQQNSALASIVRDVADLSVGTSEEDATDLARGSVEDVAGSMVLSGPYEDQGDGNLGFAQRALTRQQDHQQQQEVESVVAGVSPKTPAWWDSAGHKDREEGHPEEVEPPFRSCC